jgi:hypothetical protein
MNNKKTFVNLRAHRAFVSNVFFSIFLGCNSVFHTDSAYTSSGEAVAEHLIQRGAVCSWCENRRRYGFLRNSFLDK